MPRILGIDPSLTGTGLCRIDVEPRSQPGVIPGNDFVVVCATVGAPKPTADKSKRAMARRVNALIYQIEEAILDGQIIGPGMVMPSLIAVESLAYGAKGDSAWVLPWVFGRVIELAEKYNIALIVVGTSARAKYATGKGTSDKDTVMLAANRRWPEAEVANNNEADALVVGAVGCHFLGYPICEPTAYMDDVLAKVSH